MPEEPTDLSLDVAEKLQGKQTLTERVQYLEGRVYSLENNLRELFEELTYQRHMRHEQMRQLERAPERHMREREMRYKPKPSPSDFSGIDMKGYFPR